MRSLLWPILVIIAPFAEAQTSDVQAKADFTFALPTACAVPAGAPISQCPLTAIQAFVSTSPIADNSTMAPTAVLSATATSFSWTGTVANGSTVYGRFKAVSGAPSAFSAQASKAVLISVPGVPTGVSVVVTVTFNTGANP